MTLQLVLFDIDGTLLDGHGIGRAATRRAMLELFGTAGNLDTHSFAGKTDWGTLCEILGASEETIGRHMPAYEASIERHMRDLAAEFELFPLPGALETVQALHERPDFITGIVTGNTSVTTPIKLEGAGFDPAWFPVRACGNEAAHRNNLPPIALERACAHSGQAIAQQDVTVVGDTPADVACAQALGARAVAVTTGFSSREALQAARPDHLLDNIAGLLPLCGVNSLV
ncbi:MAG: haloacid dehalogenase-like hydrolase [Anaerolineae bacterium]|nr:haloacid dehalogenase-like hydrolase [Anaerolineae bacterium]